MSEVTKPIALDESLNTTESTPRNIADVLADELVISDLVTQATAIVTKLQALINAVKPNASDIPLDPITGMSANNVQDGVSELKGTLDDKVGYIGKTYTVIDSAFTSGTGKEVTIPSDGWYYVLAKNGGTSGQLSIYIHTDISLADYLCGVVAASSNYPDSYIRATTPMLPFKSGTKVTIRAFFTDMCELRRMT